MERAERIGLAVAVAGHVLLFGLLSTRFLEAPRSVTIPSTPIEVSLAEDITPEATAPTTTPPAQAAAPDAGPPEDAAPPPPQDVPEPTPAPEPKPQPKPEPPTPAPPKPVPPKPAPSKPVPKPAPATKPKSATPAPEPAAKPAPAKPLPARPAAARPAPRPATAQGNGAEPAAPNARTRSRKFSLDLTATGDPAPSRSTSAAPAAAKAGPFPTASIQAAIARQIQPCADRQVNPGPGASAIVTTLKIRLNPDGTLAATPQMLKQAGLDGDNDRYAQRVVDLGIAAFKGCTPLHLPAQYYRTENGGWSEINYRWQLR